MNDTRHSDGHSDGHPDAHPEAEPGPQSDGALVRAHLAGRDAPCPACGYNLRDAPGAACPECNAELSLVLAARRDGITCFPRHAGVLDTFGQLGLAAGLVIHALLLLGMLATFEPVYAAIGGGMALVAIVNGLLWLLWSRSAAWLGRRTTALQIVLAGAGWWWLPGWVLGLVIAV